MLPDEDLQALESLRGLVDRELAVTLTRAFRPAPPGTQFDQLIHLIEHLLPRLCDLANSLYLRDGGVPVRSLDDLLLQLQSKKATFGDQLRGLVALVTQLQAAALDGDLKELWEKSFARLLRDPLPAPVLQILAELDTVVFGRRVLGIPPDHLEIYAKEHPRAAASATFFDAIREILKLRNARAHREQHVWFLDDEAFFSVILGRVAPLCASLLLHAPLRALLTELERVRIADEATCRSDTTWRHAVIDREIDEASTPLGGTSIWCSSRLDAGVYWVRRAKDAGSVAFVARAHVFATVKEPIAARERRYRTEVLRSMLADGALHPRQRPTLEKARTDHGVTQSGAISAEREVIRAVEKVEQRIAGGAPEPVIVSSVNELLALVDDPTTHFSTIRQRLTELDNVRASFAYSLVADESPIPLKQLENLSGMSPETLDRVVEQLVSGLVPGKVVRRIRPAPGRELLQLPTEADVGALREVIATLEAGGPPPGWCGPLLDLASKVLKQEGDDASADRMIALLRRTQERPVVVVSDPSGEMAPSVRMIVDHVALQGDSVRDLFEHVLRRYASTMEAHAPFATGSRRYLIAREPQHLSGGPFLAPVSVEGVPWIMEGHQSRLSALRALANWFRAAGMTVSDLEIEGIPIDGPEPDQSLVAPVSVDGEEDPDALRIVVCRGENSAVLAGETVPSFLVHVLSYVADSELDTSRHVPFRMGRVRQFVTRDGRHADGRVFDHPITVGELVVEASLTRDEARFHAARFLQAIGVTLPDGMLSPDESLRAEVAGAWVSGDTVSSFLCNALGRLMDEGLLDDSAIPWSMGPIRYLVARTPMHSNGMEFMSPVPFRGLFLEGRLDRLRAVALVRELDRALRSRADRRAESAAALESTATL